MKYLSAFLVTLVLLTGLDAYGAEAEAFNLTEFVSGILVQYATKYPFLMLGFLAMAKFRTINKPLFAALHKGADLTSTKKDDILIEKVEKSFFLKAILWLSDYLISMKVVDPKKKLLAEMRKLKD